MPTTFNHLSAEETPNLEYIGNYLTSLGFCSETSVRHALERQGEMRAKGYSQLLGTLLLDRGAITDKELAHALEQQNIDRLSLSFLFCGLPRAAIIRVMARAEHKSFAPGEIIYRQGDPSESVYIILQGRVNLMHQPTQGEKIDFALLQAGEHFGEMGLLSSSNRFTTARTMEQTDLIAVTNESFFELYSQYPQVFQSVIKKWFKSMAEGKLKTQVIQDQHYKELLSQKDPLPCVQLLGKSLRAKKLRTEIDRIARQGKSALLTGEPGMHMVRVAQELYDKGSKRNGPFIIIDPEHIPTFIGPSIPQEVQTVFYDEMIQIAALFGDEGKSTSSSGIPWQGFLRVAHGGVIVIKGLERLTPKVQRLVADYVRTEQFYPLWSARPYHSKAIIIAIAHDLLALEREIYESFATATLHLSSLRYRKKDLKEMVIHLIRGISQVHKKSVKGIEQEALNVIMAYDWPGNFRELEDVVQRAVRLEKGTLLSAEDIFIGKISISGKNTFNLLRLAVIRHFFQSPFYPKAPQIVIAVMFLLVVILGLWGNPSPDSNISLLLIWANWEPLLILSCFFLARFWCSFCPVGFIVDQFLKVKSKRWKISALHLKKGYFLSALGLAVIFWSQASLDMWEKPRATAGLLIALLISAVLIALLFEGRVWCRYICPLGQMVATFSRTSIIELRANYNYCSNQCRSYDCYTGRDGIPGCRMVKGPFALYSNQNCTMCGNCIKSCPNESVFVNLRPPGRELLNTRSTDLAVLLFIPLLWGTQIFRGLDFTPLPAVFEAAVGSHHFAYALVMFISVSFAFLVAAMGIGVMRISVPLGPTDSHTLFVLAMLPLTYANEIALRLGPLLNHAADFFVILGNQIGYKLPHIAFRLDMQSIFILQIFLIIVGLLFSLYVLNTLTAQLFGGRDKIKIFSYIPLIAMAAVSICLF